MPKYLTHAVLILSGLFAFYIKWSEYNHSKHSLPNYLYQGSVNLNQHAITKSSQSEPSVLFLGSSAVSGSNFPKQSTTPDYFQKLVPQYSVYNLGVLQATILESYTYFLLALNHTKPKLVILGIDPDLFPQEISGTRVLCHNKALLDGFFPIDLKQKILNECEKKLFLIEDLFKSDQVSIPGPFHIWYRTFLNDIRHEVFGPVMSAHVIGNRMTKAEQVPIQLDKIELLSEIKKMTEQSGGKFVVFLEPQLEVDKIYGQQNFILYKEFITKKFMEYGILGFDYVDLFPNTAENFMDYIHLTPQAYEKLATKLYNDLNKAGLL